MKIKESEKIDKYLDLAKELKKLWKVKMARIKIPTGYQRRRNKTGETEV